MERNLRERNKEGSVLERTVELLRTTDDQVEWHARRWSNCVCRAMTIMNLSIRMFHLRVPTTLRT